MLTARQSGNYISIFIYYKFIIVMSYHFWRKKISWWRTKFGIFTSYFFLRNLIESNNLWQQAKFLLNVITFDLNFFWPFKWHPHKMVILKQLLTVANDLFECLTVLWGWRLKGLKILLYLFQNFQLQRQREKNIKNK